MKIGFIVDGEAEFHSLSELLKRVTSPHELLKRPLKADIQPKAPPAQVARAAKSRLAILARRRIDLAVVLLDFEDRKTCAGAWAYELENALKAECEKLGIPHVAVVIKHRQYENWLIADPDAFEQFPRRFRLTSAQLRTFSPDRADAIDALRLMKTVTQGKPYDKVRDAQLIMSHAQPLNMALNSRSFRRFLRVLEHPDYSSQSAHPANSAKH